jgi:hypothetical protein
MRFARFARRVMASLPAPAPDLPRHRRPYPRDGSAATSCCCMAAPDRGSAQVVDRRHFRRDVLRWIHWGGDSASSFTLKNMACCPQRPATRADCSQIVQSRTIAAGTTFASTLRTLEVSRLASMQWLFGALVVIVLAALFWFWDVFARGKRGTRLALGSVNHQRDGLIA